MTANTESWLGYVTGLNPLRVRRDYPTSLPAEGTPLTLVPGLRVGDKVYLQQYANKLVVVGRVKPTGSRGSWSYLVGAPAAGWRTIATLPGSGSGSGSGNGLFTILANDSSDHDQLIVQVSVIFGQVTISVQNYNTYGRGTSAAITGMRYLRSSSDGTYGPGILQVNLAEGMSGVVSVTCEQIDDLSIVAAWEPGLFDTSVAGFDTTTPAAQVGVAPFDWQDIPLSNGWKAFSTVYPTPRFRMLPGSLIELSGVVDGSAATSTYFGSLPWGTIPDRRLINHALANASGNIIARIDVMPHASGGNLQYNQSPYPAWCSLEGITYQAYQ